MAHLVDPVVADLQAEYEDAVRRGEVGRSRWIWLAGHLALIKAVSSYGALSAVRVLGGASAESRALRRTLGCSLAVAALVSALFIAGYVDSLTSLPQSSRSSAALLLFPAAVPLALPAGLLIGIVWGMGGSRTSWRARACVLAIAVVGSAASFVMLAWVTPQTNQEFRVAVFEASMPNGRYVGTVPKGARELTLDELRRHRAGERVVAGFTSATDMRLLAREYHGRWALAFAPPVLALFALAVVDRGWRRWLALIVASGGAITGYVIVPDAARTTFGGSASAVAAAWTPNLLLLMVSFALWGLRRSNPTHSRASA
jgi:lipopolysaccharide export LptBFGC system permease protein LptF